MFRQYRADKMISGCPCASANPTWASACDSSVRATRRSDRQLSASCCSSVGRDGDRGRSAQYECCGLFIWEIHRPSQFDPGCLGLAAGYGLLCLGADNFNQQKLSGGRIIALNSRINQPIRFAIHRHNAVNSVDFSFVCSRFYVTDPNVVCELPFSIGKFGFCEIEPRFRNGHSLGPFASCFDR